MRKPRIGIVWVFNEPIVKQSFIASFYTKITKAKNCQSLSPKNFSHSLDAFNFLHTSNQKMISFLHFCMASPFLWSCTFETNIKRSLLTCLYCNLHSPQPKHQQLQHPIDRITYAKHFQSSSPKCFCHSLNVFLARNQEMISSILHGINNSTMPHIWNEHQKISANLLHSPQPKHQ